jgi:hypothetical protein
MQRVVKAFEHAEKMHIKQRFDLFCFTVIWKDVAVAAVTGTVAI